MTEQNDDGTVYLVLTERSGRLGWNIVHPIPIGAMIDAAKSLDSLARQQVIAGIPTPSKDETE